MLPVLFSFGPVTIYSFGVFLALAVFITSYLFWRKGKEEHYNENELFDGFSLSVLFGAFWSRVGFVLLHFDHFGMNVLKWFDIFSSPGGVILVGLVASTVFLYRYAKKQKWNVFQILDFGALAVAGGAAVFWLGSFVAGSGFGNPTSLPWGMTFPGVFDKRHPTQLYAFLIFVLLYFFLSWAENHYRSFQWYRDKKHSAQTGFLFCVFCIVYGVLGIALSFLMSPQFVVLGYPLDIPVRLCVLLYGLILLFRRSGRSFLLIRKRS